MDIKIINKIDDILDFLSIGNNLPINNVTKPYIIHDLKHFDAKSLVIYDKDDVIAHTLVYDDGDKNTLFFGYFSVVENSITNIDLLINKLKEYAADNNYNTIRGPINIPMIIYGFGFSKKEYIFEPYLTKTYKAPIYYERFIEQGFLELFEEIIFETPVLPINPYKIKRYNFNDFEVLFPKDYNDLIDNFKDHILRISSENMPPSARITPNVGGCFDNIADFVLRYGNNRMICLVKNKINGEIIGVGTCLPDVFSETKKGFIVLSCVIDKTYRKRGLTFLIIGSFLYNQRKDYSWVITFVGADNESSLRATRKFTQKSTGSRIIMQYEIK